MGNSVIALKFYKALYPQLLRGDGGFLGAEEPEGRPSSSHLMGAIRKLTDSAALEPSVLWWGHRNGGLAAFLLSPPLPCSCLHAGLSCTRLVIGSGVN